MWGCVGRVCSGGGWFGEGESGDLWVKGEGLMTCGFLEILGGWEFVVRCLDGVVSVRWEFMVGVYLTVCWLKLEFKEMAVLKVG